MGINVLSCFDGMSCGRIALERAGIEVDNYYSSEIDRYAIQVANKNYPQDEDKRLGDVTKWQDWNIDWSNIDLVTGGFPCQAWSVAGKQLGDKDERGMLFWTMLDIMKKVLEYNPRAKFLIENVKMKKEFEEYITFYTNQALGKLDKHLINSALVSAQNRERYYWTNIEHIEELNNLKINKENILENAKTNQYIGQENYKPLQLERLYHLIGIFPTQLGNSKQFCNSISFGGKFFTLRASNPNGVILKRDIGDGFEYRKLTPIECERLQTVPDNYTEGVSNSQRYKMLGNGWTISVISHIFKGLK